MVRITCALTVTAAPAVGVGAGAATGARMQHSVAVQGSVAHIIRAGDVVISLAFALQSYASLAVPSAFTSAQVRGGGGATVQHSLAAQAEAQTTLAGAASIEFVDAPQS